MIELIDTHVHLMDKQFVKDLPQVLERARAAGISKMVNIGYDLSSGQEGVAMAEREEGLFAVVGIHPHDAVTCTSRALKEMENMAKNPKVVALGEMGLDYYRDLSPRDVQKEAFREQLRLAKRLNKPVVIHDRDAHQDVMEILKEEKVIEIGGVMHCYSGSWEMAREAMKMDLYISIAGPVTFNNARRLQDIGKLVPLNRLLIETDCPYLAPEPYRGKRNEPAYVVKVAEKIAELKGITLESLAAATTDNAGKLFGI